MTSNQIRQSFLDFFREKQHTIVPSSSLRPDSPNLLFTNAGMNQFVPYFLGAEAAPFNPPRAADTQKCIRAGGKHNDLEDVGYDTYHHTFFEMLGNWSFGDYFKNEAIAWAWELVIKRWGFPANRLYATVYAPEEGDPAEFDQEAWDHWARLFTAVGVDPKIHIVNGNAKDNFWAMGDTGPCGPCSELHVDLTPKGDTGGALVNKDDPRCIEIWNLVFIQFNRDEQGVYRPLPACHVDTGMGFERAASIMQCTKGFTDFSRDCSNYDTDVFAGIFKKLEKITGQSYRGTIPGKREGVSGQEQIDVAFRVIADHIRTVSFAIADGILPGNKGRNSTIRAILRRAVRFGRELGLDGNEPFLSLLAPVVVEEFGGSFPELHDRKKKIVDILNQEEQQFNRTLGRGLRLFTDAAESLNGKENFPAATVITLWETFGFPIKLTAVMLREKGLATDWDEVEALKQKHESTGAKGRENAVIAAVDFETEVESEFVGFDRDETPAKIHETIKRDGETVLVVDRSPLYVEKGGQLGDAGFLIVDGKEYPIHATSSVGRALCLHVKDCPDNVDEVTVRVDRRRRRNIEKHHTATHILHWALHEAVDRDAAQQGSLVAPERLRFDFNAEALQPDQLSDVQSLVNRRVADDEPVSWMEVRHDSIKDRDDIMQFFGDKYGDTVRVVQIGGAPKALDGWSMELCGGTHVRKTGEIGLFVIKSEGAISAGVRRIEALCDGAARDYLRSTSEELREDIERLGSEAVALSEALDLESPTWNSDMPEIKGLGAEKMEIFDAAMTALKKQRAALADHVLALKKERAKREAKAQAAEAAKVLGDLVNAAMANDNGCPKLVHHLGDGGGGLLQEGLGFMKKRQFGGVAILTALNDNKVHIGIYVDPAKTDDFQAGKLMGQLAPVVGGRGGGKPEFARGAGNETDKLEDFLKAARESVGL